MLHVALCFCPSSSVAPLRALQSRTQVGTAGNSGGLVSFIAAPSKVSTAIASSNQRRGGGAPHGVCRTDQIDIKITHPLAIRGAEFDMSQLLDAGDILDAAGAHCYPPYSLRAEASGTTGTSAARRFGSQG